MEGRGFDVRKEGRTSTLAVGGSVGFGGRWPSCRELMSGEVDDVMMFLFNFNWGEI
jgi:hypothetical protein